MTARLPLPLPTQEMECLVKPDQCVRVSEQDLCDILERYLVSLGRGRVDMRVHNGALNDRGRPMKQSHIQY